MHVINVSDAIKTNKENEEKNYIHSRQLLHVLYT